MLLPTSVVLCILSWGKVGSCRPTPHSSPSASSSLLEIIPHSSHTHCRPLGLSCHIIHSCTYIRYQRAVAFIHFCSSRPHIHRHPAIPAPLVRCASSSAILIYTCVFPPAPPSALGGTGGPGTWCWPPRRPPFYGTGYPGHGRG